MENKAMIKDTRETYYHSSSGKNENNTSPRFKVGDKLLTPYNGEIITQTPHKIVWDTEFGGWLVVCHLIGVHEQNYIHESEREDWIPHEDDLWSWWERRS